MISLRPLPLCAFARKRVAALPSLARKDAKIVKGKKN
jgi:hypothetical protein